MRFGPKPAPYRGVLDFYWDWMPPEMQWAGKENIVTLEEGATRLWRAKNLERYIDDLYKDFKAHIYLKLEGDNRGTKSFKDRGMTAAVTMARHRKKKKAICASTGNTLASAAAYCRAADMECFGLLPAGKVASGKYLQAQVHGAKVLQVMGNFDRALQIVKDIAEKNPDIELVNSLNDFRIEGQKTAAFEVVDALGRAPRYHFLPVGNAGNITAYWKGYKEYFNLRPLARTLPHMIGYQAAGAAPLCMGHPIEDPDTKMSAVRIGNPARWSGAVSAVKESRGKFDSVTDEETLEAYKIISALEPVTCEPSSAISVAGLIKEVKIAKGLAESSFPYLRYMMYMWTDCDIVCTLTGDGTKDPETAKEVFSKEPVIIDASYEAVVDLINSK